MARKTRAEALFSVDLKECWNYNVLPILVTYPFIQKYFVKGITLGGIKG